LPSEAEWEYGARGPMASADDLVPFPWDEEPPDCARAMYSVCGQQPADVGTHRSGDSPFGLADMAGGVWELTSDGWHENYVGAPGDGSGWPRREGDVRVPIRGASWHSLAPELVTYYRKQWRGDYRASYVGFRCAR
ncbi:MAG: formylglycine-generating enzyme family protein, partial [Deltaproteobacteria bacterium]|nr:formylglycine-generating enzyme family protein [Deltaproteobacteria bacterium]